MSKGTLTLSWRGPLSYRNQSIDLQSKSVDWFCMITASVMKRVNEYFAEFQLEENNMFGFKE